MAFPPRFLDEIRNRITLSDLIGRRIKVTRAGREFKACCPFHSEKTPSFTINDDKQFYHCFGCGAHGDVIKFTMEHDNIGFRDAIDILATEAGLEVPKDDPKAIEKAQKAKGLHDLMAEAVNWFGQQLRDSANNDVQDYLVQRGITVDVVEAFHIGYAPDNGAPLKNHLIKQGYSLQDILDVGLFRPSKKGGDPYAFFRDRVLFPVTDRKGRFVAFGGRTLPDHVRPPTNDSFTPPKYLNSSDTVLFDKGRTLYGEDKARLAAREGKSVIVTEGYMDVIACHAAGFSGAVAPMGTALTEDQIQLLWSMIVEDNKEPVLCFDGDRAGRQAAERTCDRILPLLKPNHSIRFAFLPQGEDPDSLIKNGGPAKFAKIIESAIPLIDYIWMKHIGGKQFKTPESRAGIIKVIRGDILNIPDQDVQVHYRALIDQRISETFFPKRDNRNNQRGRGGPGPTRPSFVKPQGLGFGGLYEKVLLASLINNPALFDYVEEQCSALDFRDPRFAALKNTAISALADDPELDRTALQAILHDQGFEKENGDICTEKLYVHAAFAAPATDSNQTNIQDLVDKWMEIWQALQQKQSKDEKREQWKTALDQQM